jgi:hypothetical protein
MQPQTIQSCGQSPATPLLKQAAFTILLAAHDAGRSAKTTWLAAVSIGPTSAARIVDEELHARIALEAIDGDLALGDRYPAVGDDRGASSITVAM